MDLKKIARVPEPEVMEDEVEAEAYEEADFSEVNRRFARRIASVLRAPSGRALDLGTGPADIPILVAKAVPGWSITGVDASKAMLRLATRRIAKERLGRRIRLLLGDAKSLRALRRPFDVVFSNSLLHHLPDPAPLWREIGRLLAPGGTLILQDLFRPDSRAEARRLVELHATGESRLLRSLFHQSLLAAFTPEEIRAQVRAAGLAGLSVRKVSDRHVLITGRPRLEGRRGVPRTVRAGARRGGSRS